MHITYHVWLAAIGGFLFILVGVARQMERAHLVKTGRKAESRLVWTSLLGVGACLLVFAFGIFIFRMIH